MYDLYAFRSPSTSLLFLEVHDKFGDMLGKDPFMDAAGTLESLLRVNSSALLRNPRQRLYDGDEMHTRKHAAPQYISKTRATQSC